MSASIRQKVQHPAISVPAGVLKVPAELRLNAVQRSRILEARRERVAYFMLLGFSEVKMAEELGVSPATIHYDVDAVRQQWQEKTLDNVAQAAMLDVARIDFIITGLLPQALTQPKAAEQALKAIELRAKILGYERGVTYDIEAYIRSVVEANGYDPAEAMDVAQKIAGQLRGS